MSAAALSPFSLAFRRARALGIVLASGAWDAPRLRSLERDLRRRQFHRDASGFGSLALALEADRASLEERDPKEARELLTASDLFAIRASELLAQKGPRP